MLFFVRRFLAVLLIPVFILLFLATIITVRVSSTLLEPSFYTDQLEKFQAYNFVFDEGIPAAIEKAEHRDAAGRSGFSLEEDVPLNLGLTAGSVAEYAARIIPPEWIGQNTAAVIDAAVPYLTGETDSFSITVKVGDRVEEASSVARELIQAADIYGFIFDEIIIPYVEEKGTLDDLPYGVTLTTDELVTGMKEVVPEAWLKEQIDSAVEEVILYLVGTEDTFEVTVPLQERASLALVLLERWMLQSLDGGAYDYLLEKQIGPTVLSGLGAAVELPYGVTVTNEEVVSALGEVTQQVWIAERVSEAIEVIGPYMTGETDTFTLEIPLQDRIEAASVTLVRAVDTKFQTLYDSLPVCSLQDLLGLDLTLTERPSCRPPSVSYEQLKMLVGLDVLEQLIQNIVDPLPSSIILTPDTLFPTLGTSTISILDVRTKVIDGVTFTEQDLRELIVDQSSVGAWEKFEDIRGYLRDGFDFDERDIQERLIGYNLQTFDDVRAWIGLGRSMLCVLIIVLVVIAAITGFLGGRSWAGRAIWSGVPLFIAGLITAAGFGAVGRIGGDLLKDAIRDLDKSAEFEALIAKLLEVSDALVASFVNPVVVQATILAVIGLGMIIGGVILKRRPAAPALGGYTPPALYDDEDALEDALIEGDWPSTR